jgi:hypothetical protein
MIRKTELQHARWPVIVRLALFCGLLAIFLLRIPRCSPGAYRIGTGAIVYNNEATQYIDTREHVQVLDSHLEEGRGIVARVDAGSGVNLLVADTWEAVHEYEISDADAPRSWLQPDAEAICPEGECARIEHGGFVTNGTGAVVLCEGHARRLLAWKLTSNNPGKPDQYEYAGSYRTHFSGAPLDAVAVADGTLVVALSAAIEETDTSGRPKSGELLLHKSEPKEVTESTNLRVNHPVGLAFSRDENLLYVADVSAGQLTWRYFRYRDGRFTEAGVVWNLPLPARSAWPRLHHMVVGRTGPASAAAEAKSRTGRSPGDKPSEAVFAGGPDGLYVFRGEGGLLAKYYLGAPVSGLAWGRNGELFMTIGRRVASLKTLPLETERPFRLVTGDPGDVVMEPTTPARR